MMANTSRNGPRRQRGVVMIIAVLMLLAVSLLVISSSNVVQANLKIVQNMENREQARESALAAIEEAISSTRFAESPDAVFDATRICDGDNNRRCYDYNGDGRTDVRVQVAEPTCTVVIPTPNSDLDVFGSAAEASCYLPPAIYSMCGYSVWNFEATATDEMTGAEVVVRQGVSILTSLNKVDTQCPI